MWSVGVILYILLSGTPPFQPPPVSDEHNNSPQQPQQQLNLSCNALHHVEVDFPSEYWEGVSELARDLVRHLLVPDPQRRYTVDQACQHDWILVDDGDTHVHPLEDPKLTAVIAPAQPTAAATAATTMTTSKSTRASPRTSFNNHGDNSTSTIRAFDKGTIMKAQIHSFGKKDENQVESVTALSVQDDCARVDKSPSRSPGNQGEVLSDSGNMDVIPYSPSHHRKDGNHTIEEIAANAKTMAAKNGEKLSSVTCRSDKVKATEPTTSAPDVEERLCERSLSKEDATIEPAAPIKVSKKQLGALSRINADTMHVPEPGHCEQSAKNQQVASVPEVTSNIFSEQKQCNDAEETMTSDLNVTKPTFTSARISDVTTIAQSADSPETLNRIVGKETTVNAKGRSKSKTRERPRMLLPKRMTQPEREESIASRRVSDASAESTTIPVSPTNVNARPQAFRQKMVEQANSETKLGKREHAQSKLDQDGGKGVCPLPTTASNAAEDDEIRSEFSERTESIASSPDMTPQRPQEEQENQKPNSSRSCKSLCFGETRSKRQRTKAPETGTESVSGKRKRRRNSTSSRARTTVKSSSKKKPDSSGKRQTTLSSWCVHDGRR